MTKKEIKPHIVEGRVILKIKEEPSRDVATSVPTGRRSMATSLGISSVDKILKEYGTTGITMLRGPSAGSSEGEMRARRLSQPETTHEMHGFTRTFIVKLPEKADLKSMIKKLKADPSVENAELDYFATTAIVPNDRFYQEQWGLKCIKCEEAWDIEKGSRDVTIAIVDTGVDLNHPDLADKLVPGYDMVDLTDTPAGGICTWVGDFTTRDDNPQDENGHGSHCAGIAAAITNNEGIGVAGVAWNCRIMPVRVLANKKCGNDIDGTGTFIDIADGIIWAADNGANVISLSLGGLVPKTDAPSVMKDAVDYASSKGCVLVAAMGNSGINLSNTAYLHYPSAHPKVLAVGAVDKDGKKADFSNYGDYKQVMAPGVGIRSTYMDSDYADMDGTSMATPFVSGLAALIKSADPHLGPEEIIELIRQTAVRQSDYNIEYGYGIIDVHAAIKKINGNGGTVQIDPCAAIIEGSLENKGDEKHYKITVNNTLSINLDGPDGADFDLYLKKGAPAKTYDYDKRANTVKPDENIIYPLEGQGDYYIMVKSYRGAGDFKLAVKKE